jgi:hypothetical protein
MILHKCQDCAIDLLSEHDTRPNLEKEISVYEKVDEGKNSLS